MKNSIHLYETTRVQKAIYSYSLLHDMTVNETLDFLSRREDLSIVLDLLGLTTSGTETVSVSSLMKRALIEVFGQFGFRVAKWNTMRNIV